MRAELFLTLQAILHIERFRLNFLELCHDFALIFGILSVNLIIFRLGDLLELLRNLINPLIIKDGADLAFVVDELFNFVDMVKLGVNQSLEFGLNLFLELSFESLQLLNKEWLNLGKILCQFLSLDLREFVLIFLSNLISLSPWDINECLLNLPLGFLINEFLHIIDKVGS